MVNNLQKRVHRGATEGVNTISFNLYLVVEQMEGLNNENYAVKTYLPSRYGGFRDFIESGNPSFKLYGIILLLNMVPTLLLLLDG